MQICTLTQTHNNTSIPQLSFLQAGCPSCYPTNSIKALKARTATAATTKYPGYVLHHLEYAVSSVLVRNLHITKIS